MRYGPAVTEYEIQDGALQLTVEGIDKLWALRSHLRIPLADISDVRFDPDPTSLFSGGFKVAGSRIPGVLQAGTFVDSEGTTFWDVHRPGHAIVLTLQHEHYRELVVDVEDPQQAVQDIKGAIEAQRSS